MRQRIERNGFDSLNPHEQLEYLLYFALPYRDTNAIAHKLIDKFHTLSGVLDASKEELMEVEYIGEAVASYLSTIKYVARFYMTQKETGKVVLSSRSSVIEYVKSSVRYNGGIEEFFIIYLNSRFQVESVELVASGDSRGCVIPFDKVITKVINKSPTFVIVAHNHPSGFVSPSTQDIRFTKDLVEVLSRLNIKVADHVIVGGDDYYSFYENGLIS